MGNKEHRVPSLLLRKSLIILSCMAPRTRIANDILYIAILAALPIAPRRFLGWTQLECLAYLAHLLAQPQWNQRPFCLKHFGRLLQLPFLQQPLLQIPAGLVSFDEPTKSLVAPLWRGLAALKFRRLNRMRAGILRKKNRRHSSP